MPNLKNTRITENLKKLILNKQVNSNKIKLSNPEAQIYDLLLKKAGVPITASKAKTMNRYYTDLNSMANKLQLLLGEYKAGNTSEQLQNEVIELLGVLEQAGVVTQYSAKKIVKEMLNM